MAKEENKKTPLSLSFSEKFVIQFFLFLIGSLIVIAKCSSWKAQAFLSRPLDTISIEISGEVFRPGKYEVPIGSSCADALKKVSLKRFADLSQIDLQAPAPPILQIPRLEQICVHIEGEGVEAQTLFLPPGARVADLKRKISLSKQSDLSVFHSRRMLLPGEVIQVGKRK